MLTVSEPSRGCQDGRGSPGGARSVGEGETFALPDDAIHSVVNPLDKYAGAIHVYGGDFINAPKSEWDPENHRERPRDTLRAFAAFKAREKG